MPTVLELNGLPGPGNLQGRSLVGLMAAARDAGGREGAKAVSFPEAESLEGMSDEGPRRLRSLGYIDERAMFK